MRRVPGICAASGGIFVVSRGICVARGGNCVKDCVVIIITEGWTISPVLHYSMNF